MRKFFGMMIFLFFVGACAPGRTIVIPPSPDGSSGGIVSPPKELRIGLINKSSRFLKIEGLVGTLGTDTLVLGPGSSATLAVPHYGEYGGITTAYREGYQKPDGGVKLVGYIAQRSFKLRIDGTTRTYKDRSSDSNEKFGDYEIFKTSQFKYKPRSRSRSRGSGSLIRVEIRN